MYSELDEAEKAIVQEALPSETIDRDELVDLLGDDFSEQAIQDAFTRLKKENRLFRRGNGTKYVMIRRDLF